MWVREKICSKRAVLPCLAAQLVRASSHYIKVVGLILSGHIQETTSECMNKWNNKLMLLSQKNVNKNRFVLLTSETIRKSS